MKTSRIPAVLLLALSACAHAPGGYYFWKSEWKLEEKNLPYLNQSRFAYIRMFDVALEGGEAKPSGAVRFASRWPEHLEAVPVVFITQEALKAQDDSQVPILAERIHRLIRNLEQSGSLPEIKEWQIDCDWSAKTQSRYFTLLKQLKRLEPQRRLSVTIRLHQLSTSVPPADRGMLMLYGFENPADYRQTNSIFDEKRAAPYLRKLKSYPLTLDLALPVFSWAVVFYQGSFRHMIRENTASLRNADGLTDLSAPWSRSQWFRAEKNLWVGPDRIPAGAEIRLEETGPAAAKRAKGLVDLSAPPFATDSRIVLFDFHSAQNYSVSEIEAIF